MWKVSAVPCPSPRLSVPSGRLLLHAAREAAEKEQLPKCRKGRGFKLTPMWRNGADVNLPEITTD